MKVAIAKEGDLVSGHFGHCEGFALFTIEDNNIVKREDIENPGHAPGVLPQLLADHNAEVVLAGGMGPKAVDNFCMHGIDVYTGVAGPIERVIEDFINGTLEIGQNVCHH